jgi:hypothetical protein
VAGQQLFKMFSVKMVGNTNGHIVLSYQKTAGLAIFGWHL